MSFKFFRKNQKKIFALMALLMIFFMIGSIGITAILNMFSGNNEIVVGKTQEFQVTKSDLDIASVDKRIFYYISASVSVSNEDAEKAMMKEWGSNGNPQFLESLKKSSYFGQMLFRKKMDMEAKIKMDMFSTNTSLAGTFLFVSQRLGDVEYAILSKEAAAAGIVVKTTDLDTLKRTMNTSSYFDFTKTRQKIQRNNRQITKKHVDAALANLLAINKHFNNSNTPIPVSEARLKKLYRDINEKISVEVLKLDVEDFINKDFKPSDADLKKLFEANREKISGSFEDIEKFTFGYKIPAKEMVAYLYINLEAIFGVQGDSGVFEKSVVDMLDQVLATKVDKPELGVPADKAKEIYAEVVTKLVQPAAAQKMLAAKIGSVEFKKEELGKIIEKVQILIDGVDKICFPWDRDGKIKIDRKIKLSLKLEDATTKDVLDAIVKEIPGLEKIVWSACKGFDNALFPSVVTISSESKKTEAAPKLEMFPIKYGCTKAITTNEQKLHNELSQISNAMFSTSIKSINAKAPKELNDELKKLVIEDCKVQNAFELAKKKATQLNSPKAMADYAKEKKIDIEKIALSSRGDASSQQRYGQDKFKLLGFNFMGTKKYFVDKMFELQTPKDLTAEKPEYPAKSLAASVLPIKSEKAIYIIRRIDFQPALAQDFIKENKTLSRQALAQQQQISMFQWYNSASIKKRTGYKIEKKKDDKAEPKKNDSK